MILRGANVIPFFVLDIIGSRPAKVPRLNRFLKLTRGSYPSVPVDHAKRCPLRNAEDLGVGRALGWANEKCANLEIGDLLPRSITGKVHAPEVISLRE